MKKTYLFSIFETRDLNTGGPASPMGRPPRRTHKDTSRRFDLRMLNKFKKTIYLCLFLALITGALALDQVLEVKLVFNREGPVTFKSAEVVPGALSQNSLRGEHFLKTLDSQGQTLVQLQFHVSFLQTETTEQLKQVTKTLDLPYNPSTTRMVLQKGQEVLLDISLTLCDHDGRCEGAENYNSCPSDCPSGSKDNYCDRIRDGRCDPDCAPEADIDCTCGNGICEPNENEKTCPQDCKLSLWQRIVNYLRKTFSKG